MPSGTSLSGGRFPLAVAVAARALAHGAEAAHAAIGLVHAALVENLFAGRFVRAGEEGPYHDALGAGRHCLRDVAGVLDAAVGDNRDVGPFCGAGRRPDGGHLRHADTGDDAGGADGTGADADLDRVDAGVYEFPGAVFRRDVAGDDVDQVAVVAFVAFDRVHRVLAVTVGGVDDEDVDTGLDEEADAFVVIDADGGADPEAAAFVPGGKGVAVEIGNVPHGDKALEAAVVVDEEEFFNLVFEKEVLCDVEGCFRRGGDEVVLRHDVFDTDFVVVLEAEVAAGEDADDPVVLGDDGDAGQFSLRDDFVREADGVVRVQFDRVGDDAVRRPFDILDFLCLPERREVFMDNADAALFRQGDGEAAFGDRIHGGGGDGDVQLDIPGEPGGCGDFGGNDIASLRYHQDVVKRDAFFKIHFRHGTFPFKYSV